MLFRETVAVYRENHKTMCGKVQSSYCYKMFDI